MNPRINEAHAQVDFTQQAVRLFLADTVIGSGSRLHRVVATPDGMQNATPGEAINGFVVDRDAAQGLFQELWDQGFRPANYVPGSADALDAARKEHIADLRKAAKLA